MLEVSFLSVQCYSGRSFLSQLVRDSIEEKPSVSAMPSGSKLISFNVFLLRASVQAEPVPENVEISTSD